MLARSVARHRRVLCLVWVALLGLLSCRADVRSAPVPATADQQPAWQPWSAETFGRARRENKLILLSLQADFCHWCHVMTRTTYRDPRVLALLAEHFVVLRADEASRPDLRERYAAWGWPATALLTPEAAPIVNLRGHQPADKLLALLTELVDKQRRGLPVTASDATPAPSADPTRAESVDWLSETREGARAQLDAAYDSEQGGWGAPQKYPFAAPVEQALWRAYFGDDTQRASALSSLRGYRQLIDPVAGGMYQYSLEGVWTAPHHEKLLSVQAGAIEVFSAAYRATGDVCWRDAAQQLARYSLTTLRAPDGAFYASQEADVGRVGEPDYLSGADYYARDAASRARTRAPAVDRHVYGNLNGMFIAALCTLYRADGDEQWLRAAHEAYDAVRGKLARGAAFLHEEAVTPGVFYLSDQVEMARALQALSAASIDPTLFVAANQTLDWVLDNLHDDNHDAYLSHTASATDVGVFSERVHPVDDNARLARLLLTRAHVQDEPRFVELATRTLRALSAPARVRALGRQVGAYQLALEQLSAPYVMFSVVGAITDPRAQALQRAAYRTYLPHGIVDLQAPEESRYPYPQRPALYLCSDNACSSPVLEPAALPAALQTFVSTAR